MSKDREKAVEMGFLKPTKKAAKKKTNSKGRATTVKGREQSGQLTKAKEATPELPGNMEEKLVSHYLKEWNVEPLRVIAEIALNGESDAVRLNAAKDLLDREGKHLVQKAVEKHEHAGKFEFTINVQGEYPDAPQLKDVTEI